MRTLARPPPEPSSDCNSQSPAASDDEALARAARRIDLRAALHCLEGEDCELLLLRYYEDLTQAAIARRLGMPEGTVKVRLHRARGKLHRALRDQ